MVQTAKHVFELVAQLINFLGINLKFHHEILKISCGLVEIFPGFFTRHATVSGHRSRVIFISVLTHPFSSEAQKFHGVIFTCTAHLTHMEVIAILLQHINVDLMR
jgi:hypothetical protein